MTAAAARRIGQRDACQGERRVRRPEDRLEIDRHPRRGATFVEEHPVDVRPRDGPAGAIHEVGPPPRPDPAPAHDPGRPGQLVTDADRRLHGDLGGPGQPGETPLAIPVAIEAAAGRVEPGQVLGVAQQDRRPQQAIGAGLVEADPERRRAGVGLAGGAGGRGRLVGSHGAPAAMRSRASSGTIAVPARGAY